MHTKNAIKQAFAELAMERPIEKITVRDITSRGQVSRNTFYYYFHDVYGVLEEYLNDVVQAMIGRIEEELASGADVETACHRGVEYQMSHGDLFYCIYQSTRKQDVIRCMGRAERTLFVYFVEVLSRDIPATQSDRELVGNFYVGAIRGLMTQWMDGEIKRPLQEILNRITILMGGQAVREALLRGVAHPETRMERDSV